MIYGNKGHLLNESYREIEILVIFMGLLLITNEKTLLKKSRIMMNYTQINLPREEFSFDTSTN
jgi:hypothetical protein